jgi:DNA repair protein RecN (Recombination protein N)
MPARSGSLRLEKAAKEADCALRGGCRQAVGGAQEGRGKARQGGQRRIEAPQARARQILHQIESDAATAGPNGIDRVEFWVQTNPGTRPGPMMKVASGGELARFLLALKVVLADAARRRRWCSTR